MGNKNSFIMYADAIEYTAGMTDAQLGQLYRAQLQYANGIEPEITDDEVKGLWRIIKHQMNVNSDKYESKCEKMRANASKRKQKQAIATKSKQIESDTETDTDTKEKDIPKGISKEKAAPKHKHGRYGNVLLTDTEYLTLKTAYGEQQAEAAIEYLDEYIEMKGYKAKSHYLAIRKWVFNAMKEDEIRRNRNGPVKQEESDDEFYARLEREYSGI